MNPNQIAEVSASMAVLTINGVPSSGPTGNEPNTGQNGSAVGPIRQHEAHPSGSRQPNMMVGANHAERARAYEKARKKRNEDQKLVAQLFERFLYQNGKASCSGDKQD